MRIGIDFHTVGGIPQGSQTYIMNLVKALTRIDPVNKYILYCFEESRKAIGRLPNNFSFRVIPTRTPLVRIPVILPYYLQKDSADIFHSQYICPPFGSFKNIVTIHDIIYEDSPQFFRWMEVLRSRILIRLSAKKASFVITDSEYWKHNISSKYDIPEEKIAVINLGIDENFKPLNDSFYPMETLNEYDIRKKPGYLLFVGRLEPRKNIKGMIMAFNKAKERGLGEKQLVIVGQKAFGYSEIYDSVRRYGLTEDVLFVGKIRQEDLSIIYGNSDCFVYPSFAEGFGLPVLEAMACGIPVITSNSSSLPEVAGGAAYYVEPGDIEGLAQAMIEVCENADLRKRMVNEGLARTRKFSWEKTAEKTLELYKKVYNS